MLVEAGPAFLLCVCVLKRFVFLYFPMGFFLWFVGNWRKIIICTVPMRKGLFQNSLFVKYHYKQSPDNANYFSGINR